MTNTATAQAKATRLPMADRIKALPSIEDVIALGHKTKASQIRYYASIQETEDRGAIAKVMGIRYQQVRNVLITPLTKKD